MSPARTHFNRFSNDAARSASYRANADPTNALSLKSYGDAVAVGLL